MADLMYLTQEGFEKLKKELEQLITVKRKEIAQKIKAAKDFGDLSENAEYSEAKSEQSYIEGRISELEHLLKNATIVNGEKAGKKCEIVDVGCTVYVELEKAEYKYKIVGSAEADAEAGYVSNESPIGNALMGKKVGEEVEVEAPAGSIRYRIKRIVW